jgi:Protein of unknown function (DUF3365)
MYPRKARIWRPLRMRRTWLASVLVAAVSLAAIGAATVSAQDDDTTIAMQLAELLRSARTVISKNQDLINDPAQGDKGLTGEKVLVDAIAIYSERTGEDPTKSDPATREGHLLRAQMDAIKQVVDQNQNTINAEGVGFKGFIPAVFARLVNEDFAERVGTEALVKVTAPENLVRNRKAEPDQWESSVIETKFRAADWPKGQPYSELATVDGHPAFRIIVPEYYAPSCLSCHGEPAGETDITGYPKEGGKAGELGAAISITLFE